MIGKRVTACSTYSRDAWSSGRINFCTLEPNVVSTIIAIPALPQPPPPPLTYIDICQFTCTDQKATGGSQVHRSLEFWVPHLGTCSVLPFRRFEFGLEFRKFMNP